MKRGWLITLIVACVVALGVLAWLLYKKQRESNDMEADLDIIDKAIVQAGEESKSIEAIDKARSEGRISSAQAKSLLSMAETDPGKVGAAITSAASGNKTSAAVSDAKRDLALRDTDLSVKTLNPTNSMIAAQVPKSDIISILH